MKFNEFQTNLVLTELSKEKSCVGKNVKTKRSYKSYPFRRRRYKTVNQFFKEFVNITHFKVYLLLIDTVFKRLCI